MKKKLFCIFFALVLTMSLCLVMAIPAGATDPGVTVNGQIYTNKLTLENKDANWAPITGDGIGGTLGYFASGDTFIYSVKATGLADGDYALIYYADDYPGNNPGAVIGIAASSGSVLTLNGNVNLNMDLPCPPDKNQFEYNHSGPPDNYAHAHGAKIWLIPTSYLTGGTSMPLIGFSHPDNNWLFETDLITYDDTDASSGLILEITVDISTLDFGILVPGDTGGPVNIKITNTGNEPAQVTAAVTNPPGVFANLLLDSVAVGVFFHIINSWAPTYLDVSATLPIPGGYIPTGPETGTLTFTAS